MSNIYIQEPPTEGKICLETTAGDIDIELWSREAPKACRNFVQLCLEGYYNGTIFHRLVKGFIVQGGDPTGTGTGGNSIWGKPFKDEFHSRLRFVRRGLVAMANAGRDDNGSQFFFTLGQTPELQNKHTIFAKIGGNTIYNMLKLEDGLTDEDDRPLYPHKILKTRVLSNPFSDIVPRESIKRVKDDKKDKNKSTAAATKNYKLLSFGNEAEEDEEEVDKVNKEFSSKSKSSHDLANDPKLSSQPAVESSRSKESRKHSSDESEDEEQETSKSKRSKKHSSDDSEEDEEKSERRGKEVKSVRDKLKKKEESSKSKHSSSKKDHHSHSPSKKSKDKKEDDDDDEYYLGKDEKMEQKRKVEQLRKEYKDLKRSMKREQDSEARERAKEAEEAKSKEAKLAADSSVLKEFMEEQEKYKQIQAKAPKKGEGREAMTLALLAKFKSKIETAKETYADEPSSSTVAAATSSKEDGETREDEEGDDDANDISWLAKKLHYENKDEVLAKDANLKTDDWFDIYDPRNTLSKRRREQGKEDSKEKKRSRINM